MEITDCVHLHVEYVRFFSGFLNFYFYLQSFKIFFISHILLSDAHSADLVPLLEPHRVSLYNLHFVAINGRCNGVSEPGEIFCQLPDLGQETFVRFVVFLTYAGKLQAFDRGDLLELPRRNLNTVTCIQTKSLLWYHLTAEINYYKISINLELALLDPSQISWILL